MMKGLWQSKDELTLGFTVLDRQGQSFETRDYQQDGGLDSFKKWPRV